MKGHINITCQLSPNIYRDSYLREIKLTDDMLNQATVYTTYHRV